MVVALVIPGPPLFLRAIFGAFSQIFENRFPLDVSSEVFIVGRNLDVLLNSAVRVAVLCMQKPLLGVAFNRVLYFRHGHGREAGLSVAGIYRGLAVADRCPTGMSPLRLPLRLLDRVHE